MKEIVTQIETQFSEIGVKIPHSEIETELDKWINKFKIHPEESRKYVFNLLLKQHNKTKTIESTENTTKTPKYPEDWNLKRKMAYHSANYECQYCGRRRRGLNAHHLISLSNGGSNDLDNLVCLCDECHSIIHHKNRTLSNKYIKTLDDMNYKSTRWY